MTQVWVGNLFDSKAQTLVNAVNCAGVMGKGIALQFKRRFPKMFADYAERCRRGELQLGRPCLFKGEDLPWILNFPTKGHWHSASRSSDIGSGLEYLNAHYRQWGIRSLAVPALGCGYGQLRWRQVGPLLYQRLSRLDISVELYAPFGASAAELDVEWLSKAPRAE